VSPVTAAQVLVSLLLFVLVYCVVFSVGVWYVYRMILEGPHTAMPGPETLPNRPLAGAQPRRKESVPG
jgi:cytochrome d ubiquinol oxidase subunit I